jgi:hypothetical protein
VSLLDQLRDAAETHLMHAPPPLRSYVHYLEGSLHAHRALAVGIAMVFLVAGIAIGHLER